MKTAAEFVMNTLRKAGFEAFLVGGCVRDMVLGRTPKDFDITTNATPEQVTPLFDKTIPVGAKFGVVVVMVETLNPDDTVTTHQLEVATYRADGAYSDGRRPDEVRYSTNVREDVERRDFTMNGLLLLAPFTTTPVPVLDVVGGEADIKAKLVRCIGDPNKRFEEDALRMLRAVRFVAQLGFEIEDETFKAIVANADSIVNVSRERVAEELKKLTTGKFAVKGLMALVATGLFRRIFPSKFVKDANVALMLERFSLSQTTDPVEGLAMMMADVRSNEAVFEAVASLKLSRDEGDTIRDAVYFRIQVAMVGSMQEAEVKMCARLNGMLPLGVNLFEQDLGMGLYNVGVEAGMASVMRLRSLTNEDLFPEPLVTGADLIAMGFKPSPMFTKVLNEVEFKQLNGDFANREEALEFAKALGMETPA